ncbi:hypothetical protein AVHM3334_17475 [Acidovorax sp. SUPP3334]|nr:hypothetical protein AVHM3334_17475 [Acidovorax sp. SUPP3334]
MRLEGGGVFLFTGQIGSGKSTELMRLRAEIASPQVKAFYCDLTDWLNLNEPVTLGSFLVALLSAWVQEAGSIQGRQTPAERLRDFFRNTQLLPQGFDLGVDAAGLKAKVGFALQTDPSFRHHVSDALKNRQSSIVSQAHDFVRLLKDDLCSRGEKCVLIADSLEKLRGYGEQSESIYTSLQQLFLSDGAALRLPGLHVVYSVSPFLIEQNNQLPAQLGVGAVATMPSVHVFQRNSAQEDKDGVDAMLRLIQARFPRCMEVFSEQQLRYIAIQCGGDLRDYLRSIRVVLSDDIVSLPVSDEMVEYALQQIAPPKAIPNEHVAWLARLEASHEPELSEKITSLTLQQYLTSKHVLAYLNGSAWYAVHPMLRDWVQKRAAALKASSSATATATASG